MFNFATITRTTRPINYSAPTAQMLIVEHNVIKDAVIVSQGEMAHVERLNFFEALKQYQSDTINVELTIQTPDTTVKLGLVTLASYDYTIGEFKWHDTETGEKITTRVVSDKTAIGDLISLLKKEASPGTTKLAYVAEYNEKFA